MMFWRFMVLISRDQGLADGFQKQPASFWTAHTKGL
jgi:hypothetical protein